MKPAPISVVVADDHDGFRTGLGRLIASIDGLELVGEASTGREAVAVAERLRPDVVVMDLQMPELNGVEATSALSQRVPSAGVLVLTMFEDDDSIVTALRAGARGYLLKGAGRDEIADAVTAVARGQAILDPAAARRALAALAGQPDDIRRDEPTTETVGAVVRLCGEVEVTLADRRIDPLLPGRQGRVLATYLVLHRDRPVPRGELLEALWPAGAPAKADGALRALLSKARRAFGTEVLRGRSEIVLDLPAPVWVDVEVLARSATEAGRHLATGDAGAALAAAQEALDACGHAPPLDHDAPWVHELRRELDVHRLDAAESLAFAAFALGDLTTALHAARRVAEQAPYRESGQAVLIRALAARGNVSEALRVYESLRRRLRDDLGTAPSAELKALHLELLESGDAS
jgi:pentatricopeptide repeat protein